MEIFKLFGSVFVDTDKANESLSKTDKKAEGLGKKFAAGAKTVGAWGVAVAGAAVAGGAALYGMAMKSAETADRVDKLSAKIGVSKKAFQEWDYVLGQNGMDVEKLQVGVKTLTAKMDAAATGNKAATESFSRLGLSVTDTTGKLKSQEQMTNEAIMALAAMENGTEKAKLATELFGKAGQEMMPMLNNGAEGITALKDRAHELGLVMSDEAVTAGVVLGDTMDDVKKSFGAIVTKIGVEVMPVIQKLLEWVLQYMPQIQQGINVAFTVISTVISKTVEVVKSMYAWISQYVDFNAIFEGIKLTIEAFGVAWQWLSSQISTEGTLINEIFSSIKEMFSSVFEFIITYIEVWVEQFMAFWNVWGETIMAYVGGVLKHLGTIFKTAFDLIKGLFDVFSALMKGDWDALGEALKTLVTDLWENIKAIFKNAFEMMKNVFNEFSEALGIDWKALWEGLKKACTDIWNSIVEWFRKAINDPIGTLKDHYTIMFNVGKELFTKLWDGIKNVWTSISSWVSEKVEWMTDKLMFWKKSEKEMSKSNVGNTKGDNRGALDGSHANGLSYVPFNGYRAELHEGERVLTKDENKSYSKGNNVTVNIINPSVRNDDDLKAFERMSFNAFDTTNRALGVV